MSASTFYAEQGGTFYGPDAAAAAGLSWVTIDLTNATWTLTDPDPYLTAVTTFSGETNTLTYRNTSGGALAGINQGARWVADLEDVLSGFDIDAGDQLMYQITSVTGATNDLVRASLVLGFRDSVTGQAVGWGHSVINTNWTYATYNTQTTTVRGGGTIGWSAVNQDVVSSGFGGWDVGDMTAEGHLYGTSRIRQQTTVVDGAGMTIPRPASPSTIQLVAALGANDGVDPGVNSTQDCILRIARVPRPT